MAVYSAEMKADRTDMKDRVFAILIALFLVCSVSVSAAFLAKEAGHHCTHEHCPVCSCIEQCQRTLREIGSGLVFVVLVSTFFAAHIICRQSELSFLPVCTLVSRKIRMDN